MNKAIRLLPDSFTLAILAVAALALVLPCSGESARLVMIGGEVAIALLFFLQGARLSRATVLAGLLHWRLHLVILCATFVAFPLLGLALRPLSGTVLTPTLYVGLVFLCTLPSTVQASLNGLGSVTLHLLLPFLAGQLVQTRIGAWLQRHRRTVGRRSC
jgi:sodium/bile acid cotransporter 7